MKLESVNAKETWSGGKVEQLVLEDPRSLEVLEFMFTDTSSGYTVPMDGTLGTTFSLVEPVESAR